MIAPGLRRRIRPGLGGLVGLAVAAVVFNFATGHRPGRKVDAGLAANPPFPAEVIEDGMPSTGTAVPGVTAEYGRHLAAIARCPTCHGADLRGRPPVRDGAPPAPDIAVWAAPGVWSEAQFLRTMRTGVTPWGRRLDPDAMAWNVYGRMTDDELKAIWRYVVSRAELNARDREDRAPGHP